MLKRTVGAYRSSTSRGGSRCLIIFHPPIFRLLLSQYLKLESTLSFFHFRILFQNPNSIFVFLVCRLLCGFLFVYTPMPVCSVCFVPSIPGFLFPVPLFSH